ncbi:hypothetical protein [Mesobacillus sp. LC4]
MSKQQEEQKAEGFIFIHPLYKMIPLGMQPEEVEKVCVSERLSFLYS